MQKQLLSCLMHEFCREDWQMESVIQPAMHCADGSVRGEYRSEMPTEALKRKGYGRGWLVKSHLSGHEPATRGKLSARNLDQLPQGGSPGSMCEIMSPLLGISSRTTHQPAPSEAIVLGARPGDENPVVQPLSCRSRSTREPLPGAQKFRQLPAVLAFDLGDQTPQIPPPYFRPAEPQSPG